MCHGIVGCRCNAPANGIVAHGELLRDGLASADELHERAAVLGALVDVAALFGVALLALRDDGASSVGDSADGRVAQLDLGLAACELGDAALGFGFEHFRAHLGIGLAGFLDDLLLALFEGVKLELAVLQLAHFFKFHVCSLVVSSNSMAMRLRASACFSRSDNSCRSASITPSR